MELTGSFVGFSAVSFNATGKYVANFSFERVLMTEFISLLVR